MKKVEIKKEEDTKDDTTTQTTAQKQSDQKHGARDAHERKLPHLPDVRGGGRKYKRRDSIHARPVPLQYRPYGRMPGRAGNGRRPRSDVFWHSGS